MRLVRPPGGTLSGTTLGPIYSWLSWLKMADMKMTDMKMADMKMTDQKWRQGVKSQDRKYSV